MTGKVSSARRMNNENVKEGFRDEASIRSRDLSDHSFLEENRAIIKDAAE